MPNPEFLLCDADALIQVFISRWVQLLVHLLQTYGVRPAVIPEVETEVSLHRKFKARFGPALAAQIQRAHVTVLDRAKTRRLLVSRGRSPAEIEEDFRSLATRARRYQERVDTGEAYSHAIAVELRLPLMSHDWRAVQTLQEAGEAVAVPVARLWDLAALAWDDQVLDEKDGERAIDHLQHEEEGVPRPFSIVKFRDAIKAFPSRLRRAPAGATPSGPRSPTEPLYLHARR